MKTLINSVVPVNISFLIENGKITSDDFLIKNIREHVMNGDIVILKNAFSSEEVLEFRKKIIQWGKENSLFAHGESPGKYPDLNYHRIDDGSIPSICPHIFHQYGFNNIDNLKNEYSKLFNRIANRLLLIQNAVAETSFPISLDGMRLKVLQYPQGGGFLTEHNHPKEPQQIGLVLSLSRKSTDFKNGSLTFKTSKGYVDTLEFHDIGDIVIFRYDFSHAVTYIDVDKKPIDWKLDTGKWSVVLELRETHGLSHQKKN